MVPRPSLLGVAIATCGAYGSEAKDPSTTPGDAAADTSTDVAGSELTDAGGEDGGECGSGPCMPHVVGSSTEQIKLEHYRLMRVRRSRR